MDKVLKPITGLINEAIRLTDSYESGKLSSDKYLHEMGILEPTVTGLYMQATDIGLAPVECKDLSDRFQSFVGFAQNIVLPFSERGLRTWEEKSRRYIVQRAIEDYKKDLARLEFELEKVH